VLKNSALDEPLERIEWADGVRFDSSRDRASRPNSSRLDISLGGLELTEWEQSDEPGVGVCDGGMYSLSDSSYGLR
jgi:hypothetical protein